MAEVVITVSIDDANQFLLQDSEGHSGVNNITSQVNPGDVVTWTCEACDKLKSLDNIWAKENNPDLFSQDPAPVNGDNKVWKGTISDNVTVGESESYNIQYTRADGVTVIDDPVLIVDPH